MFRTVNFMNFIIIADIDTSSESSRMVCQLAKFLICLNRPIIAR